MQEIVTGGDKANPLCGGQATQTKSLTDAVTTLEELGNCSATINQTCFVDYNQMEINMTAFDECDERNKELVTMTDSE